MHPDNAAKCFAYGVLNPEKDFHHELLCRLEFFPETGIQKEFIYKHRLTDFAPEDSNLCSLIRGLWTLKRGGDVGLFLNQPYKDKTAPIAQSIAATLVRNNKTARVMQLPKALQLLKDDQLPKPRAYVLTYPTRYNGNAVDYKRDTLLDLFMWAEETGVFLIIINDSSLQGSLNLTMQERQYLENNFSTLEGDSEEWLSN
ncbi:hypothetical protein NVP1215B_090 [Vibrio phage 1.215.B._10N.222.54.F7]|nr:hypothetical protein NVP1215A_090 [Vibrio phage 1.215.A._10N.222.54.F7]AUR96113.1 hypothetical protein NVP1215B_090 [Vibrio phage 1.215.B._10N.222.54.F7]